MERRKKYEKELHEKYLQLYHNEQCYEELMQMLEEAYQNRPAELRRLDDRREKEPNWYRNRTMLGMTMYPKLFASCGIICSLILDIPKKRTFIFKFIVLVLNRKVKGKLEKGK